MTLDAPLRCLAAPKISSAKLYLTKYQDITKLSPIDRQSQEMRWYTEN